MSLTSPTQEGRGEGGGAGGARKRKVEGVNIAIYSRGVVRHSCLRVAQKRTRTHSEQVCGLLGVNAGQTDKQVPRHAQGHRRLRLLELVCGRGTHDAENGGLAGIGVRREGCVFFGRGIRPALERPYNSARECGGRRRRAANGSRRGTPPSLGHFRAVIVHAPAAASMSVWTMVAFVSLRSQCAASQMRASGPFLLSRSCE